MGKLKVYLAHPISTTGEFNDSIRVAERIEQLGYEVYAPARNKAINDKSNNPTPKMIYKQDVERLFEADLIVVNYTGGDSDGTVFEMGMVSGMAECGMFLDMIVYSSNARAMQPQMHKGIASGKLNHMVLGGIDENSYWCGSEQDMIDNLKGMKVLSDGE